MQAQLEGESANEQYAAAQVQRYAPLAKSGAETRERMAELRNALRQASARRAAQAAALNVAQRQLQTQRAAIEQARAQLASAQASTRQSKLDEQDTVVYSTLAGRVGSRSVRVGQYLQPGTRLMTIVPLDEVYLTANFKETQIERMHPGQAVAVHIDAWPGVQFEGVVESLSPGTGSQFALLPSNNATGNFTKIVQRVPVRIRLNASPETGISGCRGCRPLSTSTPVVASAAAASAALQPPRANASTSDWIVVFAGALGALMATLDISITNSALPQIQGQIGASGTEGTWISTGYLMAEIVMIPLTAWLTRVFGLRNFLIGNAILFSLFSILCGISETLPQMIIGRLGQGFAGAP